MKKLLALAVFAFAIPSFAEEAPKAPEKTAHKKKGDKKDAPKKDEAPKTEEAPK